MTNLGFSYSQLLSDYTDYEYGYDNNGRTQYVSHSNSSFQVKVTTGYDDGSFEGSGERRQRRKDYDIGFYRATGPGDLAFYRVMKQCLDGWNSVATFNCSDRAGATTEPQ